MKTFKTPLKPIPELPRDIKDRLWAKVNLWHGITDDDCWLFKQKYKQSMGHNARPVIYFYSKQWLASRIIYSIYRGSPDGFLVCHSCDNDHCVNPSHLFLGDYEINNRDMASKGRHWALKKTCCPKGHAYDAKNTRISKWNGQRICRQCQHGYQIMYRAKAKANATQPRSI